MCVCVCLLEALVLYLDAVLVVLLVVQLAPAAAGQQQTVLYRDPLQLRQLRVGHRLLQTCERCLTIFGPVPVSEDHWGKMSQFGGVNLFKHSS